MLFVRNQTVIVKIIFVKNIKFWQKSIFFYL